MRIVECVPNISEGRRRDVYEAIARAAGAASGVRVLDVDPGEETNRTVITFVGEPEAVLEGAFRLVKASSELIDMRGHHGAHPRMGATDVVPFVPVAGVSMDDCVELARRLGERIGSELEVPVYLYEYAATRWRPSGKGSTRRWPTSCGTPTSHPTSGPPPSCRRSGRWWWGRASSWWPTT